MIIWSILLSIQSGLALAVCWVARCWIFLCWLLYFFDSSLWFFVFGLWLGLFLLVSLFALLGSLRCKSFLVASVFGLSFLVAVLIVNCFFFFSHWEVVSLKIMYFSIYQWKVFFNQCTYLIEFTLPGLNLLTRECSWRPYNIRMKW